MSAELGALLARQADSLQLCWRIIAAALQPSASLAAARACLQMLRASRPRLSHQVLALARTFILPYEQISAMQKQDKMILDQKTEREEREKMGAKAPPVHVCLCVCVCVCVCVWRQKLFSGANFPPVLWRGEERGDHDGHALDACAPRGARGIVLRRHAARGPWRVWVLSGSC